MFLEEVLKRIATLEEKVAALEAIVEELQKPSVASEAWWSKPSPPISAAYCDLEKERVRAA